MHHGKELSEDPEYLERVKQGLVKDYKQNKAEEKPVTGKAKTAVVIFLVAMLAIVTFGAVSALRPTFADGSQMGMTTIIEIFMMLGAALIVLVCKFNSSTMLDQPVFKTGMFAVVLAYGLCWMVNTFIGDQASYISDTMGAIANQYPWVYIIIAGWVACNANYVIPASGQCVAAIGFDSAGTTKIGKYVLNHSYMLPGLVMSVVTIVAAFALGMLVF